MLTKNCAVKLALAGLTVFVISACGTTEAYSPDMEQAPVSMSPVPPSSTPLSPVASDPNPTQSLVPAIILTSDPAQTTIVPSISVPTNTPLPSLPDFEEVLTFEGGGAGGGWCLPPVAPNTIEVVNVMFGESADFCVAVLDMGMDQSFHFQITAPDGRQYTSPTLTINESTHEVQWEGYGDSYGYAEYLEKHTLYLSLANWMPVDFSEGQWQIQISGDNFSIADRFSVSREMGQPYIGAVDARSETQIMPVNRESGLHLVKVGDNGRIGVIGSDFPAGAEIYILLYRSFSESRGAELVQKMSVISDSAGSIKAELTGPFDLGQSYYVVGLSDPATPLGGYNAIYNLPYDLFLVEPAVMAATVNAPSSSCPGAPTQRMVVNQRGYVCTQTDAVRLRVSPSRSADTIVQLDTGSQFTVISGPSCADNWSWWEVQTDSGQAGWLSEGGDEVDPYFICPLP
jgi:hypothetical protein